MKSTNDKIEALRNAMQFAGLDAVILPSNDPHQSEYVSDYWKIREYFSGFTGSAGTLVVTQQEAALWTDSRYFLQVEDQCKGSVVRLHRQSIPHAPEHIPWLVSILEEKATIAVDYRLCSLSQMEQIKEHAEAKQLKIEDGCETIKNVWKNRPALSLEPIVDHPVEYCGETRTSKLNRVRTFLEKEAADFYFLSSLDEICWLFNIRSNDVDFTPLVTAYAIVGKEDAVLYLPKDRMNKLLTSALSESNIYCGDYDTFDANGKYNLKEITKGKRTIVHKETLNFACKSLLSGEVLFGQPYVQYLKSIKNETEIASAKSAMEKDGVALTQFFIWLENFLISDTISEYEVGKKLETFRAKQELYKGQSFGCIVGYQSNGAIIHYSAQEENAAMISKKGILLIDSGAQYENATTDITRTIWLGGEPSEEIKKAYTLVLKGYIELDGMQFPKGTTGIQLDSFARMHLWKHGLNYGHGTGHGIGAYGLVHEPAQGFAASMVTSRGGTPHEANQFSTIEPGFYKEGAFGIRTENVVVSKVVNRTEYGEFIGFEAITLCPIETMLIDRQLMLPHEIDWLNSYHKKVWDTLSPFLTEEECEWLKKKCEMF